MKEFQNKLIILLGVGGDIGKSISESFKNESSTLITASRSQFSLEVTNEIEKSEHVHFIVDFTIEEKVIEFFENVEKEFGLPDVLINTIGGSLISKPFDQFSLSEYEKVIKVNLTSAFLITREAVKLMKRKKDIHKHIIHFVSSAAREISTQKSIYGIAKGGLVELIHYCAAEYGQDNIFINGISPTYVFTDRHIEEMKKKAEKGNIELESLYDNAMKKQFIKRPLYANDMIPVVRLLATTNVITGQIINCTLGKPFNY